MLDCQNALQRPTSLRERLSNQLQPGRQRKHCNPLNPSSRVLLALRLQQIQEYFWCQVAYIDPRHGAHHRVLADGGKQRRVTRLDLQTQNSAGLGFRDAIG